MEQMQSKVYIQTDPQNRITRCEGGYTTPTDLTGWTYLDEGTGNRYNLCQTHYFDGGLRTADGILRWKLADGKPALRTDAELEADRAAIPVPAPSEAERLEAQVTYTAMMTDTLLEV